MPTEQESAKGIHKRVSIVAPFLGFEKLMGREGISKIGKDNDRYFIDPRGSTTPPTLPNHGRHPSRFGPCRPPPVQAVNTTTLACCAFGSFRDWIDELSFRKPKESSEWV